MRRALRPVVRREGVRLHLLEPTVQRRLCAADERSRIASRFWPSVTPVAPMLVDQSPSPSAP
ncbi:MAG TPA: hypothetical protein VH539_24190, partial [Gemmatimonadaceae bacterium]